ncbi:MAG: hypothetical protein IKP65_00295 [Alphaproteobacteria bacterium]|nr:hypothetical protein [Alphaproteobacteria bacterium]
MANSSGVIVNGSIINGGTSSQYTLSVTPGPGTCSTTATTAPWASNAYYKGFAGYCTSEPAGKYYTIAPGVKVRVSQWGHKVIWISECKFLTNLDNKGNYSVNAVVDEWNNLEFNTIDEARRHLFRLTKTYKEMVAFTKKLDINTMFEDSNENKV